jgi:hypothetical protein
MTCVIDIIIIIIIITVLKWLDVNEANTVIIITIIIVAGSIPDGVIGIFP